MALASKLLSQFCEMPAGVCERYIDCAHCPYKGMAERAETKAFLASFENEKEVSAEKPLAEFCTQTVQECSAYPDCAHCPWSARAAENKKKVLGEEE